MAKFSYLANSDANTVWVVISRGVQIGTWMSYDRENQESYSEEADYESMQDTDQYQSTVQLEMLEEHIFMHGNGKTALPMHSVIDTSGNLRSRHFSAHSDDMKNFSRQRREAGNSLEIVKSESEISVSNGWKPLTH